MATLIRSNIASRNTFHNTSGTLIKNKAMCKVFLVVSVLQVLCQSEFQNQKPIPIQNRASVIAKFCKIVKKIIAKLLEYLEPLLKKHYF